MNTSNTKACLARIAIIFPFLIFWSVVLFSQSNTPNAVDWLPDSKKVVAGSLDVPENHDNPDGKKIQITYVIVKAQDSTSTAYPMIFFSGGPGGNTLNPGMVNFMQTHPLTKNRDLILFDQRGIGYSSALPDMGFESFDIMAADASESKELELNKLMIDRYKSLCKEKNTNPEYYNTIQNAKDVGMLFDHLGYGKYNLFGGSYGTLASRVP